MTIYADSIKPLIFFNAPFLSFLRPLPPLLHTIALVSTKHVISPSFLRPLLSPHLTKFTQVSTKHVICLSFLHPLPRPHLTISIPVFTKHATFLFFLDPLHHSLLISYRLLIKLKYNHMVKNYIFYQK